MKPSIAFILLAVLALAGCVTKHWTKPGATAEDFHRDSLACAQQHSARSAEFRFGFGGGYSDEVRVNKDMYRACMQAKGYQRVEGGQWEGFRD